MAADERRDDMWSIIKDLGPVVVEVRTDEDASANGLWEKHIDGKGNVYYYNRDTDDSQWERPPDYFE